MKLYILLSPSHEILYREWFSSTVRDSFDIVVEKCDQTVDNGTYMGAGWEKVMLRKVNLIIRALKENWGRVFLHSDVDVQFFGEIEGLITEKMAENDMIFQRNSAELFTIGNVQYPGHICAGFFAARGNERTLKLWEQIREFLVAYIHLGLKADKGVIMNDEQFLIWLVVHSNPYQIRWDYLPDSFFSAGIDRECIPSLSSLWIPGKAVNVPHDIVMHHANWTIGIENKIALLTYVRDAVNVFQVLPETGRA